MTRIAFFEPYYGGSHRAFADGLIQTVTHAVRLYTLPANRWKWRMRLAAPWWAGQIGRGEIDLVDTELILCSSFLDVATFRGLLPPALQTIPLRTYFHENQFAYPVQEEEPRDIHFALTNLTTALAADALAFNSGHNLESFLHGCRELLAKNNDMPLSGYEEAIRAKSSILPPGIDDAVALAAGDASVAPGAPVLLWNHRWEHDKDPEFFFTTLYALQAEGVPFRLIVLGESFRQQPRVFAEAREVLAKRILHFGYTPSRAEYLTWLQRADIVVSTARHEFFGLAVLEAVQAGCCPLLPRRLVYPELFADDFLYDDANFTVRLRQLLGQRPVNREQARALTERFAWSRLGPRYETWLRP